MNIPTLPGITAKRIEIGRLGTRVLFSGQDSATPVIFVHGNASNATYWEEMMTLLPTGYRGIAPDLRGYGSADRDKKVNALNRGVGDWVDDLIVLADHLNIAQAHWVGHSLGGAILWELLMSHPKRILSATLVDPGSPFGFGGSKGEEGKPCHPDFAGSGGGVVNPEFARLMGEGNRGTDNPQASPRVVMNTFYWKPPFRPAREEELLSGLLSEHIGADAYPGDSVPSQNYPFVAPGQWGPINAVSPKYLGSIERLYTIQPKPRILWIRGSDDQIVADNSLFDFGTLGVMGLIPGYPGVDVYPPQPMVAQTRYVLEKYKAAGGIYQEVVINETGHSPYIEKPTEFNQHFHAHIR